MAADEPFKVGDVVSFSSGPGITPELAGKFFRVVEDGSAGRIGAWRLDGPFTDKTCTTRYHATPPQRC